MNLINKKDFLSIPKKKKENIWDDFIIQEYYSDYFNELSSKELDSEFRKELSVLVKSLSKLNESERKAMINILADVINFYIENKVNKELENSFSHIFKMF